MKIIGIISTKGGVGKTTLTANLGAILADMGQKVLLVDADPQQTLSRFYAIREQAPFGLTQLFKSSNPAKCISTTVIDGLDIVIGDDKKSDGIIPALLNESLANIQNHAAALHQVKQQYDYVLIDTQGTTHKILDAVIYAADQLLSPVPPKVLDTREFIYGTVELIKKYIPRPGCLPILGRMPPPLKAVVNLWDRTNSAAGIVKHLRVQFDREADSAITVLHTIIAHKNVYTVSSGVGDPPHRKDSVRKGASFCALETMMALVHELEPKLSHIPPAWECISRAAQLTISQFMSGAHEEDGTEAIIQDAETTQEAAEANGEAL
ncbi:MAG: ParA family protein [Marinagarivorans sp.]